MPQVAEPTPVFWADVSERLFEEYRVYAEVQRMPRGGDRDWFADYQVAQHDMAADAQAAQAARSDLERESGDSAGDGGFGGADCMAAAVQMAAGE